eukprot:CAMPEP_0173192354 /NCGR_PEP_ID=MMETSP1141-20130122/13374_1 /TAXON_ID=483371 /ORGANISM="non described non described, Strain CCMP2298" /LENGTH=167 /DNA_ID=CAMNT_0014116605 /DNA_START=325 /DNA_END=824 /DNA_ORIENTATION=+
MSSRITASNTSAGGARACSSSLPLARGELDRPRGPGEWAEWPLGAGAGAGAVNGSQDHADWGSACGDGGVRACLSWAGLSLGCAWLHRESCMASSNAGSTPQYCACVSDSTTPMPPPEPALVAFRTLYGCAGFVLLELAGVGAVRESRRTREANSFRLSAWLAALPP